MNVLTEKQTELVDQFVASIENGPVAWSGIRVGDTVESLMNSVPEGYYCCRSVCDNCSAGVYLHVAKGVVHPEESPDIPCPECGVRGHIYRPPGELESLRMIRAMQERMQKRNDNPEEDADFR